MTQQRTCIFCGASGLSKEHLWPEWLLRRLPTPGGVETTAQRGHDQPEQRWRSSRAEQTARFVCGACNNQWMSQLESRVKPVLSGLLEHPTAALGREAQAALAAWSVKAAMVFEALRPDNEWFYTPAERNAFRASRAVPRHTTIWLAPVTDNNAFFCAATDMYESPTRSADETKGYVTTVAFSCVALQILTLRLSRHAGPVASVTLSMQEGPWGAVGSVIHPSASDHVEWPSRVGLNGELGIAKFSDRWKV